MYVIYMHVWMSERGKEMQQFIISIFEAFLIYLEDPEINICKVTKKEA